MKPIWVREDLTFYHLKFKPAIKRNSKSYLQLVLYKTYNWKFVQSDLNFGCVDRHNAWWKISEPAFLELLAFRTLCWEARLA